MNSITYLLERLLEQQGYVPLAVDVMYINENLFSYDHVNNPTIWYSWIRQAYKIGDNHDVN